MTDARYTVTFILMLLLQLVLSKYCQIGPYVCICILPAMILSLPTSQPGWLQMTIAFACGLLVDILADGQWGMNAAALIPGAAMQKFFIRLFISDEIVERNYSFSFRKNGFGKISGALLAEILLFMAIYVILDCAGRRSGIFIASRIMLSTLVSFVFCAPAINILCPRPAR